MDPLLTKAILTVLDWTFLEFSKSKGGGIVPDNVLEAENQLRKALAAEAQSKAKKPYTRKAASASTDDTE